MVLWVFRFKHFCHVCYVIAEIKEVAVYVAHLMQCKNANLGV